MSDRKLIKLSGFHCIWKQTPPYTTGCASKNGTEIWRTLVKTYLSLKQCHWCHLKSLFKDNPKLSLACLYPFWWGPLWNGPRPNVLPGSWPTGKSLRPSILPTNTKSKHQIIDVEVKISLWAGFSSLGPLRLSEPWF